MNSGVAARGKGLRVKLIGVEGDPDHVEFAQECLKANGFDEGQYRVFHGIASGKSGFLFFPRQNRGGVEWGLSPVNALDGKDESSFIKLPTYSLGALLNDADIVDLVHIAIYRAESTIFY